MDECARARARILHNKKKRNLALVESRDRNATCRKDDVDVNDVKASL